MVENVFSKLVSITSGLHRDIRAENDFKFLNSELKETPNKSDCVFKINFKRPLNDKKEYYYKLITNQFKEELKELKNEFDDDKTDPENKYNFIVFHNKYHKYLTDIADYISKRNISGDLSNDENYIINYLKIKAIHIYLELQEQYGKYSDKAKYTVSEIAEKYFDDTEFNESIFIKTVISKKEKVKKSSKKTRKAKTSFGFKYNDTSSLLSVLQKLQLRIDLLDNRTDIKELHNVLTAKDYTEINTQIYIQCETTQFRYIVDILKPYFTNFNPTSIERSGKFKTKTDTPMTANNLHKNKVHNPKQKEEIDKIIEQLQ